VTKLTFIETEERILKMIVLSSPALFLVVKSWVNACLFVLFFIALFRIGKSHRIFFRRCGNDFWLIFLSLLAPFLCELFAQLGRGNIVLSSLDGPSRFLMASVLFIYLSKFDTRAIIGWLGLGSGLGVVFVAIALILFPEYYWEQRAATYFVDPNTLPCFSVVLLALFLFIDPPTFLNGYTRLSRGVAAALTLFIAHESASRSSWLALVGLGVFWILVTTRRQPKRRTILLLSWVTCLALLLSLSSTVRDRSSNALAGITPFLTGTVQENVMDVQLTGTGQRVVLALLDLQLILDNPFFGLADGEIPPPEELFNQSDLVDDQIYMIKKLAGSHSEILAQLLRKGLIFGSIFLLSVFVFPVFLTLRSLIFSEESYGYNGKIAFLACLLVLVISSIGIQIFNLKMTSSFYGLILALMLTLTLRREEVASAPETNLKF